MLTNIKPWGNSQGLYIPKYMLRQLGMDVNDTVKLSVNGDSIVIRKDNKKAEKQFALESLRKIKKEKTDIDHKEELLSYLDERYLND